MWGWNKIYTNDIASFPEKYHFYLIFKPQIFISSEGWSHYNKPPSLPYLKSPTISGAQRRQEKLPGITNQHWRLACAVLFGQQENAIKSNICVTCRLEMTLYLVLIWKLVIECGLGHLDGNFWVTE